MKRKTIAKVCVTQHFCLCILLLLNVYTIERSQWAIVSSTQRQQLIETSSSASVCCLWNPLRPVRTYSDSHNIQIYYIFLGFFLQFLFILNIRRKSCLSFPLETKRNFLLSAQPRGADKNKLYMHWTYFACKYCIIFFFCFFVDGYKLETKYFLWFTDSSKNSVYVPIEVLAVVVMLSKYWQF